MTVAPGTESRGATSAPALLGLVVSEIRKTLSTSAWWALLVPAALLSLLVNVATVQGGGLAFTPALGMSLALGSFAAKFAAVYGVICASGEYRHKTITTSYLTASGRPQLLMAKVLVAAVIGAGYAIVSALFGMLGVLLGGGGLTGAVLSTLLAVCGVAVVTFALWAALGVGLGSLVSNQLGAIVGVLVYLLLVEGVIVGLANISGLGRIDEYLPGGAAGSTLTSLAGDGPLDVSLFGAGTLPWWLTLLIFAGYAVVAVLAGVAAAQRRDIT